MDRRVANPGFASAHARRGLIAVALGLVGCSDGVSEPDREVRGFVSGRAHTVDGGDPSTRWAVWEPASGMPLDSAKLGADGSFRIEVTTPGTHGSLRIGGSEPSSYHPFLYPFELKELREIDVVLIPTDWTIQRGEYAGETVATSLDLVVDDDVSRSFFSYYHGQPSPRTSPDTYALDLMVWPTDALPARVAIDHQNSRVSLTEADSAAIWRVLDRMEAVLGVDLFEPTAADPSWWPTPTGPFDGVHVPRTIRLTAQAPGWRAGVEFQGGEEVWEEDLGDWAADGRFQAFRVQQRFLDGGVLVLGDFAPFRLADGLIDWETVFAHEMMHVLGAGHTCRMRSPMGPCERTSEPTRFDVAYLELLSEIVRVQQRVGSRYGLVPAIIGERRLLLGASTLPELGG